MEATELRINNLVSDRGGLICFVESIRYDGYGEHKIEAWPLGGGGGPVSLPLKYIPLSDIWLKKAGFGDYGYGRWELNNFGNDEIGRHTLRIHHHENGFQSDEEINRTLNSVNDLQNWVFGRTGLELTFQQ